MRHFKNNDSPFTVIHRISRPLSLPSLEPAGYHRSIQWFI